MYAKKTVVIPEGALMSQQSISRWWSAPNTNDFRFEWTFTVDRDGKYHTLDIETAQNSGWDFTDITVDIPGLRTEDVSVDISRDPTASPEPVDNGMIVKTSIDIKKFQTPDKVKRVRIPAGEYTAIVSGARAPATVGIDPLRFISRGSATSVNYLDTSFVTDYSDRDSVQNQYKVELDITGDGNTETFTRDASALAEFFAPVLKYDSGANFPSPLGGTHEQPENGKEIFDSPVSIDSYPQQIRNFEGSADPRNAVDLSAYKTTNVSSGQGTIYASVLDASSAQKASLAQLPADEVAINYWMHYPRSNWAYHGGLNTHQGDWEGITLFLKKKGDRLVPDRIAYAQHAKVFALSDGGETVAWEDAFVQNKANGVGISPIVYVGLGGHASYPYPGATKVGLEKEVHRGDYTQVTPSVEFLERASSEQSPSWLRFPGRWGLENAGVDGFFSRGDDGPRGPVFQELGFEAGERWFNPWGWASGFNRVDLESTDASLFLFADENTLNIEGSNNSDYIKGDDNNNDIEARAGDDVIRPGGGEDRISVGSGRDRVYLDADGDKDTIFIDSSNLSLSSPTYKSNYIDGFQVGEDSLVVDGIPYIDVRYDPASENSKGTVVLSESRGDGGIIPFGGGRIIAVIKVELLRSSTFESSLLSNTGMQFRFSRDGKWYSTVPKDIALSGTNANDSFSSTEGAPLVLGFDGDDTITASLGTVIVQGGAGNDNLIGNSQVNRLVGGVGNDFVYGNEGDDTLIGGSGDDYIEGNEGDDILFGGAGNDTLIGGEGDDSFFGEFGENVFQGGAGRDVYTISPFYELPSPSQQSNFATIGDNLSSVEGEEIELLSVGPNFVQDFEDGTDLISLLTTPGIPALDFLEVRSGTDSETVDITFKSDDRVRLTLAGVSPEDITEADFLDSGAFFERMDPDSASDTSVTSDESVPVSTTPESNPTTPQEPVPSSVLPEQPAVSSIDLGVTDPNWLVQGIGDFNGDGADNILWRKNDGNAMTYWRLDGSASTSIDLGATDPNWSVQGVGDFNGDGADNILWRKNDGSAMTYWRLDGSSSTSIDLGATDPNWSVHGIGDFNGDGADNILWRKNDGSAMTYWRLDGSSIDSIDLGATDPNWSVQGVGDFNGDGVDDILWRKNDGSAMTYWRLDGSASTSVNLGATDPNWSVSGTGDFNGDGTDDILWRANDGSAMTYWSLGRGAIESISLGTTDPNWSVSGTGDFNGDGADDILWRKNDGSAMTYWTMGDGG